MSMPGVNGYRRDYAYHDSRGPHPRDDPSYGRRVDDYNRAPVDQYDNRYRYEREPYNGYKDVRPGYESRDRYPEPHSRSQPDHRDELYTKVGRKEGRTNGTAEYRPYKIETEEYPMVMFDLDHLATFTVSPTQGLVSPQDGIKKLHQMETQTGIWTMRVQMIIEPQDIVVIDRQSGEEMERFPIAFVVEPTAVTKADRREIYNNIVLFTVQEDVHKRSPSEMHIFQVLNKPAQIVVDEIKATKSEAVRSVPRDNRQVPPGRPHVRDHIQKYEEEAERAMLATEAYQPGPPMRQEFTKAMKRPDDTDTVVTERTDRDVQLLNHCFDDIEKFVGRLQQAADAFKELDRRRRGRNDRNRDRHGYRHGDGMLTMRSRPPPAKDFIEIFQKFKLSFNLLAKLKPHIHDPNAPELVHFLFTPLSLVVEASKDPRHGTPELASKVVSPLLSAEATDLLLNCLTSKEADLWMSLGDAWTVSRDQWKGYVPPYFPRFADGWQPDPSWMGDDLAPHSTMGRSDTRPRNPENNYHRDYREDTREHRRSQTPPRSRDQRDYDRGSDRVDYYDRQRERDLAEHAQRERVERDQRWAEEMSRKDDHRSRQQPPQRNSRLDPGQEDFLNELRSKGAKIYESTHDRTGRNEKEISIQKGEILEVLNDSRNWWKLRNAKGEEGHAPYTILTPYSGDGHNVNNTKPLHSNNTLLTTAPVNNNHIPSTAVMSSNSPHASPNIQTQRKDTSSSSPRVTTTVQSTTPNHSNNHKMNTNINDLHTELIKTLHKKQSSNHLKPVATKSPVLYINQRSSPKEVQLWLESKAFDRSIQMTFLGKNGADLFRLKKSQLENLFGRDEGTRLFSQLTVQKNVAGYNTGRSAELQAILKHRREKADTADDSGIESTNHAASEYMNDVSGYDTHASLSDGV